MRRIQAAATAWLLGLATAGVVLAGEAGVVLKRAEIKVEPFRDAKSIGVLARGDRVDIGERDGGWYRVKSGKLEGWVRMLSVRRGAASPQKTTADELLGLASGRSGTGAVVATTGIRGLDEEDLKAARFNPGELKKVDALVITPVQAQAFATAGKLVARRVRYLPEAD